MVYSQEEKHRMEALLDAFRDYLDSRTDFDVVFSRKAGFVRLITARDSDACYFPIGSYGELLEMFILDHLQDEEEQKGNGIPMDYDRVRQRLLPVLNRLGSDAEYAIRVMELHLSLRQHSGPAPLRPYLTLLPRGNYIKK